ncbi:hypothetical protein JCM21900_006892 [Sporobolomyces salmonicolor]
MLDPADLVDTHLQAMAAGLAQSRRHQASRPPSTPPDPSLSSPSSPSSYADFLNHHSPSLPHTPPSSLPTSSTGSPKGLKGGNSRKLHPEGLARDSTGKRDRLGLSPTGSAKSPPINKSRLQSLDHVEAVELPEGYRDPATSPILPRTKFPFPSVFSDDDDWGYAPLGPGAARRPGTLGRADGRRVLSQTTTTITTRKMERHHVRYSMPDLDDLFDEVPFTPSAPPSTRYPSSPLKRPAGGYGQGSNGSLKPFSSAPFVASRPRSPTAGAGSRTRSPSVVSSTRNGTRSSRTTLPSRRTVGLHEPVSSSYSPSSAGPSPRRWRTSSKVSSSEDRPSSNNKLALRDPSFQHQYADDASAASATALTETTLPLFRPFVNAFTFLVVSAAACLTVSAVLVASFSLTFYDDCGRRLESVQRSLGAGRRTIEGGIEGVRAGMGRMIGNARGALDLAVKAAGAITSSVDPAVDVETNRRRTAMPTVHEEEDDDDEGEQDPRLRSKKGRPRSASMSRKWRSSSAPSTSSAGRRPRSPFGGPSLNPVPPLKRRSFNPFATFSSPSPVAEEDIVDARLSDRETRSGWDTDDSSLPYDVPHSTPHASRPASPRRAPRSRQSSNASTSSALPPRPPLAILLPSVLFALLLTMCKVAFSLWKGDRSIPCFKGGADAGGGGRRGRRHSTFAF